MSFFQPPSSRVATWLTVVWSNVCERAGINFYWYPRECSLCCFLVLDLEVSKGIDVLGDGDDSQEFFKVLLLEVLLGQVLELSLGEGDLSLDND